MHLLTLSILIYYILFGSRNRHSPMHHFENASMLKNPLPKRFRLYHREGNRVCGRRRSPTGTIPLACDSPRAPWKTGENPREGPFPLPHRATSPSVAWQTVTPSTHELTPSVGQLDTIHPCFELPVRESSVALAFPDCSFWGAAARRTLPPWTTATLHTAPAVGSIGRRHWPTVPAA